MNTENSKLAEALIRQAILAGVSIDMTALLDPSQPCDCPRCVSNRESAERINAQKAKSFPEPTERGYYWAILELGFDQPQLVYVNRMNRLRLFGVNSSYPMNVARQWLSGPVTLETPKPAHELRSAETTEEVKAMRDELMAVWGQVPSVETADAHAKLIAGYEALVTENAILRNQLQRISDLTVIG